ncbi:MAG: hypothetical protein ABR501_09235 [Pyrinomonadaceae bacterium]
MPFNLLLLPLLGGFYFFSSWYRTAYFAKRQDKERLLLYSSLWGLLFLAISFFLSILIPYSSELSEMRRWWAFHTPPVEYSGISSFAFALGLFSTRLLNAIGRRYGFWQKEGERVILTYGSQLEKLLFRSLSQGKRVMVTLKNGKVYIGRVAISLTPQEDDDFLLLPSKSGYRDDKHRLTLTTDYDLTYKAIVDTEENYIDIISDFGVVVPIPEVVSASLYREDVHIKYFHHEDPPDAPIQQLNPAASTTPTAEEHLVPSSPDKVSK